MQGGIYQKDISKVIMNVPDIEKLKGKRILVTGATGLICSAVVDILFQLNLVNDFCMSIFLAGRSGSRIKERFPYKKEGEDYTFIEYDSTYSRSVEGCFDYIIHGASNADPRRIINEPVETLLSNVVGLKCLLDNIVCNHCGRLLYVSSSEVYGNKNSNTPFSESDYGFVDILNPRACYPVGKRAAESLCASYGNEYGVDFVICRPGHIYGPTITMGDSRASSQFPRDIVSGKDIIMKSEGRQMRSYCYVLDCASAILTIMLNGVSNNAYNISNKNSVCSIREMAEAFAFSGNKKIVYELPTELECKSYNMMNNSSLNATKLEALGWKAEFSMSEGAKHTIDILKGN